MPEIIDWQRLGNPRAIRFVASSLRRGALVAFPTQASYVVAGWGLLGDAVERMQHLVGARPLSLAVSGLPAARDWLPRLGEAGHRLARRFWPGPLTLVSTEGVSDGLAGRLPRPVQALLQGEEGIYLSNPASEILLDVLGRLSGPVVSAAIPFGEGEAFTARQVIEGPGRRVDLVIDDGPGRERQQVTVVEVQGERWTIQHEGGLSAEGIRQQLASLILFVCTGNTCRSPMAEALCKKRLADRLGCSTRELPSRGYLVMSAGLAAGHGMPAAGEAIEVARAFGADLDDHESRPLTVELAARADHLLVMTRSHARALADQLPEGLVRPELLSPEGEDVSDPIGGSREVYEACARQLDRFIEHLLARILPARG